MGGAERGKKKRQEAGKKRALGMENGISEKKNTILA